VPAAERGGVLGDSRQNGNAAVDHVEHLAHDGQLLVVFERRVLADGAEQDDAVDAGIDQGFEVSRGGGEVERLVAAELSREGGEDAVPVGFHECVYPLYRTTK